ncbi:M16 family metallopeptidase [Terripilifer ovatus]|uniref:M16 family metallopeptidase n=1 Tax=Terripilifer ovatus TaxID=3032367 RepID=UPI003AB97941
MPESEGTQLTIQSQGSVQASPASLTPSSAAAPAKSSGPEIGHFFLDNGLEVVVIPDHRAPVVTHMVWYRNGSADDPVGKSGIAHFLEHLMFKGTKRHPKGEFSDIVAELGGQENAFTSIDYTAYYQRVPKEHLAVLMDFEADRMTNLVLTDDVVTPERDVVLEERRMRTDSDPGAQLGEAVQAALYTHHPYGKPIIGWEHEIETLDRTDALAYYNRFYTPENAVLIVAGDVLPEEVRALAEASYGKIKAHGEAPKRMRTREPQPRAHRLVTLADDKVEQPSQQRVYLVPSYTTAAPGDAEALELAAHLLGGGPTSLLYRSLVVDKKIAVAVGAYYMGTSLDDTRFFVYAVPAPDVSLEELDDEVGAIIDAMGKKLVDEADLARAKTRLIADAVYAQDSQTSLARWYGAALTTGHSVADVKDWPNRIDAVSAEQVRAAVAKWLELRRSVTGFLLMKDEEEEQAA